jgi:cytochrome c oxidase subunit 2
MTTRLLGLLCVAAATTGGGTSGHRGAQPIHEVTVIARQFAFEPPEIQVSSGETVRLVVRSADAAHGLAIRDLHIDVQVPRGGEAVAVEFVAPPPGHYAIICSEFCGPGHSRMRAALVSVAPIRTSEPSRSGD